MLKIAAVPLQMLKMAAVPPNVENGSSPAANVENGSSPAANVENGSSPAANVENGSSPAANVENGSSPAANVENGSSPAANVENDSSPAAKVGNGSSPTASIENGGSPTATDGAVEEFPLERMARVEAAQREQQRLIEQLQKRLARAEEQQLQTLPLAAPRPGAPASSPCAVKGGKEPQGPPRPVAAGLPAAKPAAAAQPGRPKCAEKNCPKKTEKDKNNKIKRGPCGRTSPSPARPSPSRASPARPSGPTANTTFVACVPSCIPDAVFRPPRGRSVLDRNRPAEPIIACVPLGPAAAAAVPPARRRPPRRRQKRRSRGCECGGCAEPARSTCDYPSPGCCADTPECLWAAAMGQLQMAAALGAQMQPPFGGQMAGQVGPCVDDLVAAGGLQWEDEPCAGCPGLAPPLPKRKSLRKRRRRRW